MFSKRHKDYIERIGGKNAAEKLSNRIDAENQPQMPRPRFGKTVDKDGIAKFWENRNKNIADTLTGDLDDAEIAKYSANIENLIGFAKMPIGVAGPLLVRGLHAHGEYLVPLATTEAALVASYSRGAHVITKSGGAITALLSEGVMRTPAFVFFNIVESGSFVAWVSEKQDEIKEIVSTKTRHGKLELIEPTIDNDVVFLCFRYSTGDASGQNMVTIVTDAICHYLIENSPIKPKTWFVEGNYSGDKKASYLGLINGRGRKVSSSITIPEKILKSHLHTSSEQMLTYYRVATLGAQLSGQIGAQGHFANALAALYIATGQDAACVSESSVGFTRLEAREDGLFISVTLPNLMISTIGGGTSLPTQKAALELMGLYGNGKAHEFAEVAAAICLAGEISIMAAIAAGHFTRAHGNLARDRR